MQLERFMTLCKNCDTDEQRSQTRNQLAYLFHKVFSMWLDARKCNSGRWMGV